MTEAEWQSSIDGGKMLDAIFHDVPSGKPASFDDPRLQDSLTQFVRVCLALFQTDGEPRPDTDNQLVLARYATRHCLGSDDAQEMRDFGRRVQADLLRSLVNPWQAADAGTM